MSAGGHNFAGEILSARRDGIFYGVTALFIFSYFSGLAGVVVFLYPVRWNLFHLLDT